MTVRGFPWCRCGFITRDELIVALTRGKAGHTAETAAAEADWLEVVEAERDALEAKLNEVSKQPLRPSATSAFNDLDRVMLTVDRTRRAVKSGETVRYEVIGDQIETNAFALGSLDAQAAADAWSKRSQEAAAFCGKMNQELAYGTTL